MAPLSTFSPEGEAIRVTGLRDESYGVRVCVCVCVYCECTGLATSVKVPVAENAGFLGYAGFLG